jgi:hypothetical protein
MIGSTSYTAWGISIIVLCVFVILAVGTLAYDFGFVQVLYFDFGMKQILKLENFFEFFNRF